jgi:hypothetical protein
VSGVYSCALSFCVVIFLCCSGSNALIRRVPKEPEGEWRSDAVTRAPEIGADNGSRVMNSPGSVSKTELSGGALGRAGLRRVTGEEAKGQGGSFDPVMVAKASLRASERPFRVSGSGGMRY